MSFHTSRTLSRYGTFSAFSGVSPELFPGGPSFIGGDDQGVFYGANTGFTAGAKNQGYLWVPADRSLATKAANKWIELSDPNVSDKDAAFKESMTRKFNTLLQSFFGAVGNHSMLGYSPDATQQIIAIGDQLKAALRQLIAYRLTPVPVEPEPVYQPAPVTEPRAPSSTSSSYTQAVRTESALTAGGIEPAAGGEQSKTLLYVGIGVGVLALAAILLRRPRAVATAGYRRRRRRR